jgi:hypothetical protein
MATGTGDMMQQPIGVVSQHRFADRVEFRIDGQPFTSYVFGDAAAPRPYFYPLLGPDGQPMTRRFPMETTVPDEPTDHPHHRSLWAAHGDVNGHDNWNAKPGHAFTRFRRLEETTADDALIAHADWVDANEHLLCRERLAVRIVALENQARLIDWQVTLTSPDDAATTLGDTKEGGLVAVRVAAPLMEGRGGKIENADGAVGEAACWGKPSRWCDYSGALTPGGDTVGIAILDHPESFRHPTIWHVRGYGLFAANPIGRQAFDKSAEPGDVTLEPGNSLHFHYAVVIHRGDARAANIQDIWTLWSGLGPKTSD